MSISSNEKNITNQQSNQTIVPQVISQQREAFNLMQSRNDINTNTNNSQATNNIRNQILADEKKLTLSELVEKGIKQRIHLERSIQIREYIVQVLVAEKSLVEQVQRELKTIEGIYVNSEEGWKLRDDKIHPALTGKVYVSASKTTQEILKREVKNKLNKMTVNVLVQQGDNRRIHYNQKFNNILTDEERNLLQYTQESDNRLFLRLREEEQETLKLRTLIAEVERLTKQTGFDKSKIEELNKDNVKHQSEKNDLKKKLSEQEKLVGGKQEMQKILEANKKEQEEVKKKEDKLNETIKELKNEVQKQKDQLKAKDNELGQANMVIDQLEEKMIQKELEFLEKQKEVAELKKKMALFQPEIQFCQQQLLRNLILTKDQQGGEEQQMNIE